MICMEMGDDLGHLTNCYLLITHLCSKNFKCYCIVKNLQNTTYFSWPDQVVFLQAPMYLSATPPRPVYCFADILLYKGYKSVDNLGCLVDAWKNLYNVINPVCAIFDHSPTALLALRSFSLPKFIYSNGFVTLPVDGPYLNLRSGNTLSEDHSLNSSQHVTHVINQYLIAHHENKISHLGELYQSTQTILTGHKVIDIYREYRKDEIYICPPDVDFGFDSAPSLKNNADIFVFAYIKNKAPHSGILVKMLKQLNIKGICYYAGITEDLARDLSTNDLCVTHKPVSIQTIINQVNVVICHAGKGLINSALTKGLPMILMPTQLEQRWTTGTLEKRRSAIGIYREDTEETVIKKIESFFSNPDYQHYARTFASELNDEKQFTNIANVLKTVENAICHYLGASAIDEVD